MPSTLMKSASVMRSYWRNCQPTSRKPLSRPVFKEVYNGERNPSRVLLPVRNLQFWIESNVLLVLKDAAFDKRDAQLIPTAGSCADCPKRTGQNKLLFGDDLGKQGDRCTDPVCYQSKLTAHVSKTVARQTEPCADQYRLRRVRKKAVRFYHATSTQRSATTSRNRKTMRSGPSSKRASSPPRPSSPKVRTLAPSTKCVPIRPAPSIIRSSQPAATMRNGRPSRRSSVKSKLLPMLRVSAYSPQ